MAVGGGFVTGRDRVFAAGIIDGLAVGDILFTANRLLVCNVSCCCVSDGGLLGDSSISPRL